MQQEKSDDIHSGIFSVVVWVSKLKYYFQITSGKYFLKTFPLGFEIDDRLEKSLMWYHHLTELHLSPQWVKSYFKVCVF
jgi:hypothetical protein